MDETKITPSSPQSLDLIRNFLQTHHSGVLATADTASAPHAATIYFSADDSFCLTFATKTETQKYKNLEQNTQVAFVCYDEKTQTTLQVTGHVEKVTDPHQHQAALNTMYRLSETISGVELPPIEKLFAGKYVVFKVIPQVIKLSIFLRPDAESNEEIQEIITFTTN